MSSGMLCSPRHIPEISHKRTFTSILRSTPSTPYLPNLRIPGYQTPTPSQPNNTSSTSLEQYIYQLISQYPLHNLTRQQRRQCNTSPSSPPSKSPSTPPSPPTKSTPPNSTTPPSPSKASTKSAPQIRKTTPAAYKSTATPYPPQQQPTPPAPTLPPQTQTQISTMPLAQSATSTQSKTTAPSTNQP